jgi:hypothetical protein
MGFDIILSIKVQALLLQTRFLSSSINKDYKQCK